MKVKEFLDLFIKDDYDKEICIYLLDKGERIIINEYDIDFDVTDTVDINVKEREVK